MSNTGALLREANRLVRESAIDRDAFDTVTAVATWPELVEAVQVLVSAQPASPDPMVLSTMSTVGAIAAGMRRDQLDCGWPTVGAIHEGLLGAVDRVNQVAIDTSDSGDRDRVATVQQAFGMLYHAAHVIRTGLEDYLTGQIAHRRGKNIGIAGPMFERVNRSEQLLDAGVNPWPWTGPTPTDPQPTQQLAHTFACWDIAAHRALVVPSTATIQVVASGEALATRISGSLLEAAREANPRALGVGDPPRLSHSITQAAERWQDLAVVARKSGFARSADRGIHDAFLSMRHSLRQVMPEAQHVSSATSLAQRVDLAVASRLAHQVLTASADLAKASEAAVGVPGPHGSTRALLFQQRQIQGKEVDLVSSDQGLSGTVIPIPPEMCELLRRSSIDVVNATERVASLSMPTRPPGPCPAESTKTPNQRPERLLGPSRPIGLPKTPER